MPSSKCRRDTPGPRIPDEKASTVDILKKCLPYGRLLQGCCRAEDPQRTFRTCYADVQASHVGDKSNASSAARTSAHTAQDDDIKLTTLICIHGTHSHLHSNQSEESNATTENPFWRVVAMKLQNLAITNYIFMVVVSASSSKSLMAICTHVSGLLQI